MAETAPLRGGYFAGPTEVRLGQVRQPISPWLIIFRFAIGVGILYAITYFVDIRLVPDWNGYRVLYLRDGAWLRDAGRDPVFVYFNSLAAQFFGVRGYEEFRSALFGSFIAVIALIAAFLPRQRLASPIHDIITIGSLLGAMYCLKALVQVREGMGFSLIVIALILAIRWRSRWSPVITLVLALLATGVHAGLWLLSLAVTASWLLMLVQRPDGKFPREMYWLGVVASVVVAIAVGLGLNANPAFAFQYFGDVFVEGNVVTETSLLKLAYWLFLGLLCFAVHRQCLTIRISDTSPFGVSLNYFIACSVIPVAFLVPFTLTFLGFNEASVIATLVRLLMTVLQVGLFVVVASRSSNWLTTAIIAFLLVDQIRILMASIYS